MRGVWGLRNCTWAYEAAMKGYACFSGGSEGGEDAAWIAGSLITGEDEMSHHATITTCMQCEESDATTYYNVARQESSTQHVYRRAPYLKGTGQL